MNHETTTNTSAPPVLTPESMQACRQQCWLLVGQLASIDADVLRAWISLLETQDAVGCIFDPTGWIRTAKARDVSLKMLRAVEAFKREIEKP